VLRVFAIFLDILAFPLFLARLSKSFTLSVAVVSKLGNGLALCAPALSGLHDCRQLQPIDHPLATKYNLPLNGVGGLEKIQSPAIG
jgi:hypothetical protein